MKEKMINYWKEHKEDIKTYAILVLAPIAVMGIASTKALTNVSGFLEVAARSVKEEKK